MPLHPSSPCPTPDHPSGKTGNAARSVERGVGAEVSGLGIKCQVASRRGGDGSQVAQDGGAQGDRGGRGVLAPASLAVLPITIQMTAPAWASTFGNTVRVVPSKWATLQAKHTGTIHCAVSFRRVISIRQRRDQAQVRCPIKHSASTPRAGSRPAGRWRGHRCQSFRPWGRRSDRVPKWRRWRPGGKGWRSAGRRGRARRFAPG